MILLKEPKERESGDVLKEMTNVDDVVVKDVPFLFCFYVGLYVCTQALVCIRVTCTVSYVYYSPKKKKRKALCEEDEEEAAVCEPCWGKRFVWFPSSK